MNDHAVLAAWDLGGVLGVARVPAGSVNQVFRVQSGRGVFFLRAYRATDRTVVEREHALIGQVKARGVPAVPPVPTRGGGCIVEIDSVLHALYPQAQGDQVARADLLTEHATAAGARLAELHLALADLPDVGYRRYRLNFDAVAWRARLDAIETAIAQRPAPDDTDRWALDRLRAQRDWLHDPRCPHAAELGGRQVTHGDDHDANLFFSAGRVSAVIDWEQAAFMPRAFEVVRAAGYMFGLEAGRTRAFLGAHAAITGMSAAELTAGAQAWGVMADHHVWALEEAYVHGNDRARAFILHRPFAPFRAAWAALDLA